jgi:hypothetical protein
VMTGAELTTKGLTVSVDDQPSAAVLTYKRAQ